MSRVVDEPARTPEHNSAHTAQPSAAMQFRDCVLPCTNIGGSDNTNRYDAATVAGQRNYEKAADSQIKSALPGLQIDDRNVAQVVDKRWNDVVTISKDSYVDKLSGQIAAAIARDNHIGDPDHPTYKMFQEAIITGTLDQVIEQANQKLWKTSTLHADLYVEEGREIQDMVSKRITLMTSHTGRILGQADVLVANKDIEPQDPNE